MKPDGFDEALEFHKTGVLPLQTWSRWAHACCRVVETKYKFMCSWSFLLGMNVGMLQSTKTFAEFRKMTSSEFNRSSERRFSFYLLVLADMLCGTNDRTLAQVYRGNVTTGLRAHVPRSILSWPKDNAETERLLQRIKPVGVAFPMTRDSIGDFYVNLIYGYYTVTHDMQALDHLHAHRKMYQNPLYGSLIETDDVLASHFRLLDTESLCANE